MILCTVVAIIVCGGPGAFCKNKCAKHSSSVTELKHFMQQWCHHLTACLRASGRHFEHSL